MNTVHYIIYIGHMFGYEHERVCFARIGECDGGMSATIISSQYLLGTKP